jgi:CCR4-NOT transcription complex subunit 1
VKSLTIEAYHMGSQELLYVIPFVAKILESCAKSKVKTRDERKYLGLFY